MGTGLAQTKRPKVAKRKKNEKMRAENMVRGECALFVLFRKSQEPGCSVRINAPTGALFIRLGRGENEKCRGMKNEPSGEAN